MYKRSRVYVSSRWFGRVCGLVVLLLLFGHSCRAGFVTYVNGTTGDDANDGLSWETARKTVQAGVDAMTGFREVWVAAGTYYGNVWITADVHLLGGFAGKETSRFGRNWRDNETILDGQGTGAVVSVGSLLIYGTSATVEGFTIRNGGAGVSVFYPRAEVLVARNRICNNSGGVYAVKAHISVVGNAICNNTGDGVHCGDYTYAGIGANTIAGNGGVGISSWVPSSDVSVGYNIVAFNGQGGIWRVGRTESGDYNCVYNPGVSNYRYSGPGEHDIQLDPLFVDQASGDFQLQITSPCVNAGTSGSSGMDLDCGPRVRYGSVDLGAYECGLSAHTISEARMSADGVPVSLSAAAVAAAFGDAFYVESDNRAVGIRVERPAHGLNTGTRADLTGTLETTPGGERRIAADSSTATGTSSITPAGMVNRMLGGGDWQYVPNSGRGQMGVDGSSGLNNIGLLVTTWGRVTFQGRDWFYIDDGSGVSDGSGIIGIYVDATGLATPPVGAAVAVTGISSCDIYLNKLVNVLRPRSQSDIRALTPP